MNEPNALTINADEAAAAGVRRIELIEGSELERAQARVRELEAQLGKAEARNALLFKEKADAIARITELEKKFADEREYSEWLQSECDKAVNDADAGRIGY